MRWKFSELTFVRKITKTARKENQYTKHVNYFERDKKIKGSKKGNGGLRNTASTDWAMNAVHGALSHRNTASRFETVSEAGTNSRISQKRLPLHSFPELGISAIREERPSAIDKQSWCGRQRVNYALRLSSSRTADRTARERQVMINFAGCTPHKKPNKEYLELKSLITAYRSNTFLQHVTRKRRYQLLDSKSNCIATILHS